MTSLIAWIGVDSRGPASFYLASDSRISWGPGTHWDVGRKLFTSDKSPDLFGYCGDVLFPSLFLSQVSHLIDLRAGPNQVDKATFGPNQGATPEMRHESLVSLAQTSFGRYPALQQRAFSILHCSRQSSGMSSVFHLWRTDWSPGTAWHDEEIVLPTESVLVLSVESGASTVSLYDAEWRQTGAGRTSRAVFSAFCDALRGGGDQFSGGAPQLVGLYRKGFGEACGVIYRGVRYPFGLPIDRDKAVALPVEWRNELFERCDGRSMDRLQGTQRHCRPCHVSS
jgi:hypothetical protein